MTVSRRRLAARRPSSAEPWPRWTLHARRRHARRRRSSSSRRRRRRRGVAGGLSPARGPITLDVRPFLSGRDYHALHHENADLPVRRRAPRRTGACASGRTPGVPAIAMRIERHLRARAGLVPQLPLRRGARPRPRLLGGPRLAGDPALRPVAGRSDLADGRRRPREPRSDRDASSRRRRRCGPASGRAASVSGRRLDRAADAYLVRRGAGRTIVAGYPWFTDWGRDTFIALRGLCLATGRLDEARRDPASSGPAPVSEGMLPNCFPDARRASPSSTRSTRRSGTSWPSTTISRPRRRRPARARGARRGSSQDAVGAILDGYARGHPLRHPRRRGRPARRRRAGRAAHLDGREGRRLGRHAADRQARRGPGPLAERASRSRSGVRPRWQPLLDAGTGVLRERASGTPSGGYLYDVVDADHQPGTADPTLPAQPDLRRRRACRIPLLDGRARAPGRRRGRGAAAGRRSACARCAPGRSRLRRALRGRSRASATARTTRARPGPGSSGAFVEAWVRVRGGTRRRPARGAARGSWRRCSPISTRPVSATSPRSPTAIRRTRRAAAPSRPGRWASCSGWTGSSSRPDERRERRSDPERDRLEEDRKRDEELEALGALPLRAAVGHRARGLQRRTARPGTTSRTTMRARAPTAGARTACWASATTTSTLCFALALWNGRDPILKERLFGLTGPEGNHGEDVKEYYFYLDSTPTHSYMKVLYKYPQREFPYARLVEENRRRGRDRARVRAARHRRLRRRPLLRRRRRVRQGGARRHPDPHHAPSTAGPRRRRSTCCRRSGSATPGPGAAATRRQRLRAGEAGTATPRSTVEHAEHSAALVLALRGRARAPVHRERDQRRAALRRAERDAATSRTASTTTSSTARARPSTRRAIGTKAAAHYVARRSAPGEPRVVRLRLSPTPARPTRRSAPTSTRSSTSAHARGRRVLRTRWRRRTCRDDARAVQRQAFAGHALEQAVLPLRRRPLAATAIPAGPPPPPERLQRPQRRLDAPLQRRRHLDARQVGVPLVRRLGPRLPLRSRSRSSTRTSPRSSSSCSCASGTCTPTARSRPTSGPSATSTRPCTPGPPGASTRSTRSARGTGDRDVPRARLPQAAAQLHLVGQPQGRRGQATSSRAASSASTTSASSTAPRRCRPAGTSSSPTARAGWACTASTCWRSRSSWPREDPAYEDVATKFFEHFVYIADAMNNIGGEGIELWDEEDGFFYDVLHLPDGRTAAAEGPLDGRADPALRGRDARARRARPAARLQAPAAVVPREPAGPRASTSTTGTTPGRAASGASSRSSAASG